MNILKFFRGNKKSKVQDELEEISIIQKDIIESFLSTKKFKLVEHNILDNQSFPTLKVLFIKDELFILLEIIKVDAYAKVMSGKTGNKKPHWEIDVLLGEGTHEFPELEWSAVNLTTYLNNESKEYHFNSPISATKVFENIIKDLASDVSDFLNGDLTRFLNLRIKQAEEKTIFPIITQKANGETSQTEDIQQIEFKMRYSKKG